MRCLGPIHGIVWSWVCQLEWGYVRDRICGNWNQARQLCLDCVLNSHRFCSIWFFSVGGTLFFGPAGRRPLTLIIQRSQIPNALSSNESTIDTATFGIPVGNWPATGCNIQEFFQPQQLVFDITLCGGATFSVEDVLCADD